MWGASNEYLQHMFLWRTNKSYRTVIVKYTSISRMCFSKGGILWRFVIKICLIKRSTEVIRTQWQNFLQDPRIFCQYIRFYDAQSLISDKTYDPDISYLFMSLTLLLLNTTCSVWANSVDPDQLALKKPTDLALHCLSLNMWISIKNPD